MSESRDPVEWYRRMRRLRRFEMRAAELVGDGEINGPVHEYIGEEAVAVGVCAALRADDVITSTHRGHGHILAKGGAPDRMDRMFAELLGRESGYNRGRGGSMHIADLRSRHLRSERHRGGRCSDGLRRGVHVQGPGGGSGRGPVLRRRGHEPGGAARIVQPRRDPPPAGGLRVREQRIRHHLLDPGDAGGRPRPAGGGVRASPPNRWTAWTCARSTRRAPPPSSGRGRAAAPPSSSSGPPGTPCTTSRPAGACATTARRRRSRKHASATPIERLAGEITRGAGWEPGGRDAVDDEIEREIEGAVGFARNSPRPRAETALDYMYADTYPDFPAPGWEH